ncbi:MAG TPA: glycosyltransferase, partial [Gemmatimonadaceae bacterium]|nr:glycosyltransferase [Gemmatimonadaceae bacterium]
MLAVVVDWITDSGGGETVLSETLKAFPGATVFSVVDTMGDAEHARLGIPRARTTWLQRLPAARRNYRPFLPLMPMALRGLDVSGFDTVLAISHAVAKAPPVRPGQRLLCLTLSPMRYAWDLREQYLAESGLDHGVRGAVVGAMLDRLRAWDLRTSARVDAYASISQHIAGRVRRNYGRESVVIFPPVDTDFFTPGAGPDAARAAGVPDAPYVTASRFVPYKRMDLIVRAFAGRPDRKLVVIGDGPDRDKVRAAAAGVSNVTFIGHAPREEMRRQLRGARAFVFAAEEDFG